ncbi:hypothetical protein [Metaclostridioides mangenotii]|uniref:Transposase n=1 Tax=Metaclostridioides mangenotii TaxID=1540 RepID=A0ABS4E9Q5_9FIRM|nr:hypothetical protein [Clostridioides mangenotii]MBP1854680.1 transposase [Clostridioides mangenotii]
MRSKVLQMAAAEASKKYGKETVEAVLKEVDKARENRKSGENNDSKTRR